MREKILTFIEKNSRIDLKELAIMLGVDEASVVNELELMEKEHIICGYHTLIDWDKAGIEKVTAMIEVRVTPQRGMGFDKVAERIYSKNSRRNTTIELAKLDNDAGVLGAALLGIGR